MNELNVYQKPVVGWKLSCEESQNDDDNFTRQDAYDLMFKKMLNT